jgi:curli biogenesis system outer membrane secretion channel CsgG
MKRLAVTLFMSALVIYAGCASDPSLRSVEPIDYNKRMLVAVSDIQNQTGNRDYDPLMGDFTGSFTAELHETGCFRVIERQKLQSIMEEMKLGMAGLTDPAKTREAGKMAGAEAILFVNLASVKYNSTKDSTFFAQNVKEEIETIMDARLVAVETGEILAASKISIPFTNRYRSFCLFKDGEKADQKLIVQQSLEKAIKHLAREVAWQVSKRGR